MQHEQIRAEFERSRIAKTMVLKRRQLGGGYAHAAAQIAWLAWLEARAQGDLARRSIGHTR